MAIYRKIQMTFWTDSKVVDEFTPEDKYFYLYLLTNPHTNLCGCYELSIKQASVETGYTQDVIETLLDRFENVHDVIRYSKATKEILLLNWSKFNWTKSKDFQKPLLKEIAQIKDVEFKRFLSDGTDGVGTIPRPSQDGVGTTVTVSVTDTVTVTDKSNGRKPEAHKERYGEFENVLLTDEEHAKLVDKYPMDYQERIDALSEYIAQKGKSYKSHYATILAWARKEKKDVSANETAQKKNRSWEQEWLNG